MEDKLIFKDLTYKIRGRLFEVHNELGRMRNEQQYGDAIEEKFRQCGILYEREKKLKESFPGEKKGRNRVDFLVENCIILEIKTKSCLSRDDYFQCQRYLASTGLRLALLVNFRSKYLTVKRILNHALLKKNPNI